MVEAEPFPSLSIHRFDGDGMLHAVRIKDGSASYCNHWVRTSRLAQEKEAGWPLFAKVGNCTAVLYC
jgi:carotenoid cleavage dioxygenase